MTDETKALVERLRNYAEWVEPEYDYAEAPTLTAAADLIEAQAAEIEQWKVDYDAAAMDAEQYRDALKQIEQTTYPRPLGKPWRMDLSSSKHDRCIHDAWMYETCERCLDAFVNAVLAAHPATSNPVVDHETGNMGD